jgi:CubicO group peptidase (beta-lactamase class C family)
MIRTGLLLLAALTATASASEPVSGWPIAGANYDQEKMTALDQAVTDGTYKKINSVIVIRSGELLIERYYNGATRNQTHDPRSVGKTFAATILGIAIDDGYIESIDQRLGDFYDLNRYENYSDK